MKVRVEEVLAVQAMNDTWRSMGDPRQAAHSGAGHAPDVTINRDGAAIGVGEISVDHDAGVMATSRELRRIGHDISLPAGRGHWLVNCKPTDDVSALRRSLPGFIEAVRLVGLDGLSADETPVAMAQARRHLGMAPGSEQDHLLLVADAIGVRSLRLLSGDRDAASLGTSGGGSSGSDGEVISKFLTHTLTVEPHAGNVVKLLKQEGERHVVVVIGTRTREHRWDVFYPIAWGGGFEAPPVSLPRLASGLSGVWLIDVYSGWAACWSSTSGWTVHEGRPDWWRDQSHLPAVQGILKQRGEVA